MSTMYTIIGAWQTSYANTLPLAERIARQMTADDGEVAAVYRMSCTTETTPVSRASLINGRATVTQLRS